MIRTRKTAMLLWLGAALCSTDLLAAPTVALAGRWRLNRELSDFPKEVAFGFDTGGGTSTSGGQSASGGSSGGRRSRGSSGGSSSGGSMFGGPSVSESEDDARKIRELIADAKNPSAVLTIAQTAASVTITDASDRARTFHPNGKEETQHLEAGGVGVTSSWSERQLVIKFAILKNRWFVYTYSRSPSGQLVVETRLEEGRAHDTDEVIKRVYDPE